jgi:uncharacterized protein (TIGR02145 family)
VLKAGRYWSPVNVGATKIEAVTSVQPTDAQVGLYIQWGRTTGFYWNTYNAETDAIAGPLAADDPSKKVILCNGDWLSSQNDLLWSGEKAQGPCPDGWKVPTRAEAQALIDVFGTKTTPAASDRRWTTTGDNGNDVLYFVSGGFYGINSTTALPTFANTNNNTVVWLTEADAGTKQGYFWFLENSANRTIDHVNRSWAMPVRCIQQ